MYTVRKITGRFRKLEERKLEEMRVRLEKLLASWGAVTIDEMGISSDGEYPLWMEVEFLDNIVQYEMDCNPFLRIDAMN
jgi:hypothetical protein